MNKKILFTPVGGSDPISNERDGSILHICRIYKPDEVYLFFSKEMYDNHMKDNRYLYCIEKLGELLHHQFECHLIFEKDLTEVQQYDIFYHIFQREIGSIKEKMDDTDILYLNTSSGTPGMKSALFIMSTLGDYQMVSLQVSTPNRSINPHFEVSDKNYDIELYWEFNKDNEDFHNRCEEVKSLNLLKMLKMDLVKKHISAFNYNAAYDIAMTIDGIENEKVYSLLKMAKKRSQLFIDEAGKIARQEGVNLFPVNEGNYKKVFEYAMVVWLKMKRGEYADYIRALTPLIVELYELILKKECGIDMETVTSEKNIKRKKTKNSLHTAGHSVKEKDATKVKVWDKQKILEKNPEIARIFDNEYKENGGFLYKEVYSIHIVKLIENLSSDDVLKMKISDMTDVEQNIRNIAAHTITAVSDEDIKQKVGKNAAQIFEMIKYFCVKAGMSIKEGTWNTYIDMNQCIMDEIDNMKI